MGCNIAIFTNDFEEGDFSAWTGTTVTAGSSIAVQHDNLHHNSHGATSTIAAGAGWKDSLCYKSGIGDITTCYMRGYFYIDAVAGNETRGFIGLQHDNTGTQAARVGINGAANRFLYLYYRSGGAYTTDTSATAVPLDEWFCLELKVVVHNANGEVRVYLNGAEVADLTHTGLNNSDITHISYAKAGVWSNNGGSITLHYDCIVVDSSYIGEESEVETYTKSFTFDGLLQKSLTKTLTFDGLLQKSLTKAFTFDGQLTQSFTKAFSFDALLQKALTKEFSFDGQLQQTLAKAFTFDAFIEAAALPTATGEGNAWIGPDIAKYKPPFTGGPARMALPKWKWDLIKAFLDAEKDE